MKRESNKLYVISICVALVLATIIAYEPVRHNDFVGYDDPKYITKNPNVSGGITRQSVIWAFTKSYSANWHPLTWLSHMLDCEIYGLNPLGHHITNVLIHTANSVLLFWVLRKMTGTIWPGAFIAAIFALHPVHVESVAWAAERKDVLSSLFWMLTMLAYVRYAEQPNLKRYVLVLSAFLMGLMSKPMVVTLPLVLLLLDWWPLDRLARPRKDITAATRKRRMTSAGYSKATFRHLVAEKVPLLVLSGLSSVITLIAQHSGGAVTRLERVSLDYRIANMFVSYIKYIGKMIWPSRLAVFYPRPHLCLSSTTAVIYILSFILISFGVYVGRRKKYITTGWLWYIGTLVPVIGLVQVGSQAMANRYMYIPMIGLLIIGAWAVKDLIANRPRWKVVTAVLTTVALSCLLVLSRMQVKHWQDSVTLLGYTVKVTENNAPAENNYGCALSEAGRLDEAVLHLTKAIQLMPAFAEARDSLCKVLLKQGKLDEAIACLNEIIERKQDSAEAHYNLGMALSMQRKYDDAIKHYAKVLYLAPHYPDAHAAMGVTLLAAGRPSEAIAYLNEALRIDPEQAKVYVNLGIAYTLLGKYELAIRNYNEALRLKPDYPAAINNLKIVLKKQAEIDKALRKKKKEP